MNRIFTLFLLVFFISTANASTGNWLKDLEQAKKLALSTDKLIIVDFWASWCGPCKRMDKESWSDPEIQKIMKNYVPLQIDIDVKKRDAMKYGVRAIPYIFIIDGNGEVIYRSLGYMPKQEVARVLKKYALNTSFLKNAAVKFYQHQNYVTSLRLAERYLDFSLYLDNEIKPEFLNVAENYLKQGEKSLSKRQKNFKFIKEKVELLELTASLYAGDKSLKKDLEKINSQDLDARNLPLFAYINLCLNQKNNIPKEVEKWSKILEEVAGGEKYFVKAKIFSGETT